MSAPDPYGSLALPGVVGVLLVAIARASDIPRSVVVLTNSEADFLRRAGFPTAATGVWTLTPVPPRWLVGRYPELAPLADPAWKPPPAPTEASCAPAPPSSRSCPDAAASSRWTWPVRTVTVDQRRVLASLVAASDPRVRKRTLQQRLRRLPATSLNRALSGLIGMGVVARDGGWLVLVSEARTALLNAGIGVRRAHGARAVAEGRERQRPRERQNTRARGPRQVWYPDTHGRLHALPAHGRNSRRPVPPVGTSAWGRSQLGRRGGLAVQRLYRKFGVHPTAAATQARRVRRQRQQHAAAVRSSPVVTPFVAPPPIEAAALASRGYPTAARLAAVLASQQPIGRRERLEEERRRR